MSTPPDSPWDCRKETNALADLGFVPVERQHCGVQAERRYKVSANCRQAMPWTALFLALSTASPAWADAIFNVNINTASLAGTTGKLTFDYLVNNSPSGHHVEIMNFLTNSSTFDLPESAGGLVEGNVFLPPFTTVGAPLTGVVGFSEIGGGFFFNELILNLKFGTSISFQLHIPEYAVGVVPDQFSLFLLNSGYAPLFPTNDPTGANALFAVDITGPTTVAATAFAPAILSGSDLNIVTPGTTVPVPDQGGVPLLVIALGGLIAFQVGARRKSQVNGRAGIRSC